MLTKKNILLSKVVVVSTCVFNKRHLNRKPVDVQTDVNLHYSEIV